MLSLVSICQMFVQLSNNTYFSYAPIYRLVKKPAFLNTSPDQMRHMALSYASEWLPFTY